MVSSSCGCRTFASTCALRGVSVCAPGLPKSFCWIHHAPSFCRSSKPRRRKSSLDVFHRLQNSASHHNGTRVSRKYSPETTRKAGRLIPAGSLGASVFATRGRETAAVMVSQYIAARHFHSRERLRRRERPRTSLRG